MKERTHQTYYLNYLEMKIKLRVMPCSFIFPWFALQIHRCMCSFSSWITLWLVMYCYKVSFFPYSTLLCIISYSSTLLWNMNAWIGVESCSLLMSRVLSHCLAIRVSFLFLFIVLEPFWKSFVNSSICSRLTWLEQLQLATSVTFAYQLCFFNWIHHWKDLDEKFN